MIEEQVAAELMSMVAKAENSFLCRWRLSSLERVDVELREALAEQISLYLDAMAGRSANEARIQAEAMVRGWAAATKAMLEAKAEPDAYTVGYDRVTDTLVVIGDNLESVAHVVTDVRNKVQFTPDEIARIVCGLSPVLTAKKSFPDAELIRMWDGRKHQMHAQGEAAVEIPSQGSQDGR